MLHSKVMDALVHMVDVAVLAFRQVGNVLETSENRQFWTCTLTGNRGEYLRVVGIHIVMVEKIGRYL